MTTRIALALYLVFNLSLLFGQDFSENYVPIQNKGNLPNDLLSSSTQKYIQRKKTISKKEGRKTKKAKSNFYLESSFAIDELFHSGKILFSDPEITEYINDIADGVLKDDPSLRAKLHFYTVKSPSVNAFATDRGSFFFTLGLLAKLNSEAELAFILSHEIAHYTEKHSLNSAVTFDKINRTGKKRKKAIGYKNSKSYNVLLKKSNYSKKKEQEADYLGGKRFLKTNYNPAAINSVFDVLEFAHVPLENDSLDTDFLDLDELVIPKKKFLKKVKQPEPLEDSEYSTHPGIDERRESAKKLLKDAKTTGKDFIISEERFKLAKETAIFELCDVFLQNSQYPDALYFSSILLKKYPKNQYLKRTQAYSLYGLAQYTNLERKYEVIPDEVDFKGALKQIYHVTDVVTNNRRQANLVAIKHCWEYNQTYPDDKGMELALRDEVEDLVIFSFENDPYEEYFSDEKIQKVDSLKHYGLIGCSKIKNDPKFQKMLKDGEKYRLRKEEEEMHHKKKSVALGKKSALFLNPAYYRVNVNPQRESKLRYVYSEKRQNEFDEIIKTNAKRVGLKVEIIDSHKLKSQKDAEKFHDLTLLHNFQDELLNHDMYMIVSSYNRVQPLVDKFNTPIIVNTGNISAWTKPKVGKYPVSFVLMIPPFTSNGIKRMFSNYQGFQYSSVINFETNEILHKELIPYEQKDIRPLIEMTNYNLLYKIQATKKSKK